MAPLCPPRPTLRGFASPYDGGMGEWSASPRAARMARGSWGFGPRAARTTSMSHCRHAYHTSRPGADHEPPPNTAVPRRGVSPQPPPPRGNTPPGNVALGSPTKHPPESAQPPGQRVHGKARRKRGADTEQDAKRAKRHNHLAVLLTRAHFAQLRAPDPPRRWSQCNL